LVEYFFVGLQVLCSAPVIGQSRRDVERGKGRAGPKILGIKPELGKKLLAYPSVDVSSNDNLKIQGPVLPGRCVVGGSLGRPELYRSTQQ
jgi:hypothetical protein